MKYLVLDCEGSKIPVFHPWQDGSFICSVGWQSSTMDDVETIVLRHATEFILPQAVSIAKLQKAVDEADLIIAHNVKFDINWLKSIGINFAGKKFWCTCVADYLLQGQYNYGKGGYTLNRCAARYKLGAKEDQMATYWNSGYQTDEIPLDEHLSYLKQDVRLTKALYENQLPRMQANNLMSLAELSFEVSDILSDMEVTGVLFDKPAAEKYIVEFRGKLSKVDRSIFDEFGAEFNLGSAQQLSAYLYGGTITIDGIETYSVTLKSGIVKEKSRKCKIKKSIAGAGFAPLDGTEGAKDDTWSVGKKVIALLRANTPAQKVLLDLLLDRSKMSAILEMFVTEKGSGLINKIGIDGGIHPSLNQITTVTGRLSSSNPNGQNLPRKGKNPVKNCFLSRNGVIVNIDLAQIEFRVAAELSRDPVMMKEIKEGLDVHTDNAIRFFDAGKYTKDSTEFQSLRNAAKTLTFRLLYGGSAGGFFRDGSMPRFTLGKWKKIVDAFYAKYKVLREWQKANVDLAYSQGYLRNPSGRILRFKLDSKYGVPQLDEADICNYPVQSSSADIMFLAMVNIRRMFRQLGLKSQIVLQVHDSLVIDAFKSEVDIICEKSIDIFRNLPELCKEYWGWDMDVPLDGDAEVGDTYGTTIKYGCATDECTHCVLKFSDESTEIIEVTNYVDLTSNVTYLQLISERKLIKITFKG